MNDSYVLILLVSIPFKCLFNSSQNSLYLSVILIINPDIVERIKSQHSLGTISEPVHYFCTSYDIGRLGVPSPDVYWDIFQSLVTTMTIM